MNIRIEDQPGWFDPFDADVAEVPAQQDPQPGVEGFISPDAAKVLVAACLPDDIPDPVELFRILCEAGEIQ